MLQATAASTDLSHFCGDIFRILDAAAARDQRLTALKLTDLWLDGQSKARKRAPATAAAGGSGEQPTASVGVWPASREDCETALAHLLLHGRLKEDFHFTPYSTFSYLVKGMQSDKAGISMSVVRQPSSSAPSDSTGAAATSGGHLVVPANRPRSTARRKRAARSPKSAGSTASGVIRTQEAETIDISSDSSADDDLVSASKRLCPSPARIGVSKPNQPPS